MKTIALFGASGKSGQQFLAAALAADYRIKALVRNPDKIRQQHPNLTLIQGDVLAYETVAQTIEGCSLVVSLIGHVKDSPASLQSKGIHYIIKAMQQYEISRLISLTYGAVKADSDDLKFKDYLYTWLVRMRSGRALRDANRHTRIIKSSNVAWEIVRVWELTDEPRRGSFRVGRVGEYDGKTLGRADLADFLVQELNTKERMFQMPMVSY